MLKAIKTATGTNIVFSYAKQSDFTLSCVFEQNRTYTLSLRSYNMTYEVTEIEIQSYF